LAGQAALWCLGEGSTGYRAAPTGELLSIDETPAGRTADSRPALLKGAAGGQTAVRVGA